MLLLNKIILFIFLLVFWIYSTFFYAAGAAIRLDAERTQDINLYKKLLNGYYPLKTEALSALLDKLFFSLAASPDLINNPSFVGALEFAVEEAEKEMRISPNNLFLSTQLAQIYTLIGAKEKAVFYIDRSISLSPSRQTTLWGAATLFSILGERARAEEVLSILYSISPSFLDKFIK